VALFSDVEDIFNPPEFGNDDSIKEIATILTEEGLRANFLVIGERARVLQERNRKDVIASLQPHEVGLHTRSAYHPEVPEYVAGKSWEEGVAECLKHEREGREIIGDVFGKPCVALSSHYLYIAPHAQRAAAIIGLPFVYATPAAPPLYSLSWYAGALGLPWGSPTLNEKAILPYMEGFDDKYPDNKAFEAYLSKLDERINICLAEGQPYLTLFIIHPQRVRLKDFIDIYWSPNGVNYPKDRWGMYGRPPQYTPEQVKTLLANVRRLARWVRHDPRLNVITVPELVAKYGRQPASISRQELSEASREITAGYEVLIHARFSPAEILVGLAQALVFCAEHDELPAEVTREEVLGPTRNPIWIPELQGANQQTVARLACQLLDHTKTTGQLPATLGEPLARVGINHLYRAFAEVYLAMNSGSAPTEVRFRRMPPWPNLASAIGITYMKAVEGELMDPDTEVNTLYRDGKLQTWTLKPAVAG
jgi:peptidoglycan/xylan/chitin deacetylase (PgdA/CDA1 family)